MIPALHLMHFLDLSSSSLVASWQTDCYQPNCLWLISITDAHRPHTHTWHQQTLSLFARVHCICSCSPASPCLLSSLFASSPLLLIFAVAVVLHLHGHTTTCRDLIFLLTLPDAGIFPNAWHASPINFFKPPSFLSSSSEYITKYSACIYALAIYISWWFVLLLLLLLGAAVYIYVYSASFSLDR